ncbi:class I SAM-dependent methyltransferase [Hymenobacter caeli]|uniref:tRNA (Cmo5U34)-methyltransferase n=1 Tax=Hymenobacter caeli TaxID=2735894 RepID=A0ABX2FLN1_9BACT|nr:class I SAM-dependent methyltransferase [Hymenobacter caeli]NRT17359.1 tRNA (cmo5U34)-methyltransferase [Hymenobacter caeli]
MHTVKEQFDAVSARYDQQRPYLIPCYDDFYAVANPLLRRRPRARTVLDVGAGTGLFSSFLYQQRPDLEFTLVDLAPEMLAVARQRFAGLPGFAFRELDFAAENLPGTYDLVISSLAIHHLPDAAKASLYQRIYGALNPGGLFVNADQVLGRTAGFDAFYRRDWRATVRHSGLPEEAIGQAFERVKLDDFGTLEAQLRMLEAAGFQEVDCLYKNLSFAVLAGAKGDLE